MRNEQNRNRTGSIFYENFYSQFSFFYWWLLGGLKPQYPCKATLPAGRFKNKILDAYPGGRVGWAVHRFGWQRKAGPFYDCRDPEEIQRHLRGNPEGGGPQGSFPSLRTRSRPVVRGFYVGGCFWGTEVPPLQSG